MALCCWRQLCPLCIAQLASTALASNMSGWQQAGLACHHKTMAQHAAAAVCLTAAPWWVQALSQQHTTQQQLFFAQQQHWWLQQQQQEAWNALASCPQQQDQSRHHAAHQHQHQHAVPVPITTSHLAPADQGNLTQSRSLPLLDSPILPPGSQQSRQIGSELFDVSHAKSAWWLACEALKTLPCVLRITARCLFQSDPACQCTFVALQLCVQHQVPSMAAVSAGKRSVAKPHLHLHLV